MEKITEIEFELELEGKGIVNYDSKEQNRIWNRESKRGDKHKNKFTGINDNVSYAKKVYFRDENDVLKYLVKISSNSLRNNIFSKYAIVNNPSIMAHSSLLNSHIAGFQGILRGYMLANSDFTLKRKSPLSISSAIQTSNGESSLDFFTRSGDRDNTSLFSKETIGEITYKANGSIDLAQLQFISADDAADRKAFNSDDFDIYKKFLENTLRNTVSEPQFYELKTASTFFPEFGIKLNNENVNFLTKELLKRIIEVNIKRNNSFAKFKTLKIRFNQQEMKTTDWVKLETYEDVDNINFETYDFYKISNLEDVEKLRKEIDEIERKNKEKKKEEEKKKAKK